MAIHSGNEKTASRIRTKAGTITTVLLLAGAIGWFANGIRRLTGVAAPADPWGGHTLEWTADPSSVEVTSERPLLDALENSGVAS